MRERDRRISISRSLNLWKPVLASASAGALNRASAIGIRLITVPLLLRYLGPERYGLWMTIASATAYLTLLDLGTVAALTNRLTRCYVAGKERAARTYVVSATLGLACVAVIGVACAVAVVLTVDWARVFQLHAAASIAEVRPTLIVATLLAGAQLMLAATLRLPYTMQRGALSEGYQLMGNIASLAAIIVVVRAGLGLPWLALALMAGPIAAAVAVFVHLVVEGSLSRPRASWSRHALVIRSLARAGGSFVVMQVAGTLLFALQFPLLAASRGAAAVTPYALLTQLMLGLQTPLTVLQQPLWTRIASLRAQADISGVSAVMRQYFIVALGYSLFAALVLVFLMNPVLALLAKSTVLTPMSLRLAFALLCGLGLVGGGNLGSALLALDLSGSMAAVSILQLTVFLAAAAFLVPAFGAAGMALSVCAIYFISLPPTLVLLDRRLRALAHGPPAAVFAS